jgi:hypothetical protein
MKKIFLLPLFFMVLSLTSFAQKTNSIVNLPDSIYSGKQGKLHVQGIVVDQKNGFIYFSFTGKLIKMDLTGKVIGSVTGFVGHLGDLTVNPTDGKIYGSLEYKNDAIGKGIKKALDLKKQSEDGFYVAIFDGSRITRENMDAEKEDLIRTVYIKEAVIDYKAKVKVGDVEKEHRFACSGIDGVTFAPEIGGNKIGKNYLYVAYGVYGDTDRNDNDNQVILKYDVSDWDKYAQALSQDKLHQSGPAKPLDKYFVPTGSTRYGIQNLEYDASTGNFFAAVYRGSKSQFPNYDLYLIDGSKKPSTGTITSDNNKIKVKTLSLVQAGPKDPSTGIRGWNFKWGATGFWPLGNGLFYISHNGKSKDGQQESTVFKYKWVGDENTAFIRTK